MNVVATDQPSICEGLQRRANEKEEERDELQIIKS
jgi:hypothetical protein